MEGLKVEVGSHPAFEFHRCIVPVYVSHPIPNLRYVSRPLRSERCAQDGYGEIMLACYPLSYSKLCVYLTSSK